MKIKYDSIKLHYFLKTIQKLNDRKKILIYKQRYKVFSTLRLFSNFEL